MAPGLPAAHAPPTTRPGSLAEIDLPGGGIAAAALIAAYLGAARGTVTADDVAAATKWELASAAVPRPRGNAFHMGGAPDPRRARPVTG